MSNDESMAITLARVDENVKFVLRDQQEIKQDQKDIKKSVSDLKADVDGKNEMTRKDLDDLKHKYNRLSETKLDKSEFDQIKPIVRGCTFVAKHITTILISIFVVAIIVTIFWAYSQGAPVVP